MVKALILVHGMGVQGTDWASSAMQVLETAATSYGLGGGLSRQLADGKVALMPVSYDDRFTAWVNRWGRDSRELAKFIKAEAIDVPANIVGWLENADETENNFLWSHVVDVVLYRFFNLVTTDVRVHVMRDVARIWTEALAMDSGARISVLAHSLGTSVTHDSLALLATNPPPGAEGFLAGDRRLSHIFMVANVSRILETLPQVYDSVICPPSVIGARAYCGALFNVRHELDPFPAPRSFKPAWGGPDFMRIRTTAVREFNVHSLERYLEDPRVHIAIFRSVFGFGSISDQIARQRIDEYDAASGPSCAERLREFIDDCRNRVQLIEDSSDIKTLISAGVHFLADVDEVRAKCKEEIS